MTLNSLKEVGDYLRSYARDQGMDLTVHFESDGSLCLLVEECPIVAVNIGDVPEDVSTDDWEDMDCPPLYSILPDGRVQYDEEVAEQIIQHIATVTV